MAAITLTLADFMAATEIPMTKPTIFDDEGNVKPELLTPWFLPTEPKPTEPGEYEASYARNSGMIRWWNGYTWSRAYSRGMSEADQSRQRTMSAVNQDGLYWRGLSAPPLIN